jgi:hypothetical protein
VHVEFACGADGLKLHAVVLSALAEFHNTKVYVNVVVLKPFAICVTASVSG